MQFTARLVFYGPRVYLCLELRLVFLVFDDQQKHFIIKTSRESLKRSAYVEVERDEFQ